MDKIHPYDDYWEQLQPALKSKAEELLLIGYGKVEAQELWNYLTRKKWKKPKTEVHLHELVSDVLSIKAGDYMNYATIEAFKSPNWFAELNSDELQELLKPNDKTND
ncbi:post-transcriptional regulator [Bacillus sp. FJAT-49736]|uniref:post-transcriptional regulator n=1 Tax=Bacillus sp. FJAT-49736 TaxID=2833582 RepID=UPI001BC955A0|nr:post-transcriptional regulator [Bacillus sp. FJAT-49736]MBS4173668.1 post-transcriptional regulator [Bacillus sp. FJAT-49736]